AVAGSAVGAVGVDQRQRGRRGFVVHQVVVHHHHIEGDLVRGLQRGDGGGPAVHGDNQFCAHVLERAEGEGRRAEAFGAAIGDVEDQLPPPGAEIAGEDGGRRAAVDIVVGEDRDLPVRHDGVEDHLGGAVHVGEGGGIGEQVLQGGV